MSEVGENLELKAVRNESDLYGYTVWLASYLGYEICPRSLRNFQHGWIWWDMVDGSNQGLDPNIDSYWGILVQDDKVATTLHRRKIFAQACGLPFLNFLEFSGVKNTVKREFDLLYVPTHSNPWNDLGENVINGAEKFCKKYQDAGIMLSWSDRHLKDRVAPMFSRVEIGAGALEVMSFYRLAKTFQSYKTMITDSMGSHVLYAMACGMNVGIDAGLYYKVMETNAAQKGADIHIAKARNEDLSVFDLAFLDTKFPGLVIDGNVPQYCNVPFMPSVPPQEIARLLGWDITYPCEIIKLEV